MRHRTGTRARLRIAGIVAGITLAGGFGWSEGHRTAPARQEKPAVRHGEKCPAECPACTEAIRKALDFLASRQVEDGCIPAHDPGLAYVRTDRTVTHVMTTTLASLAFLAGGSTPSSGPYRDNLALARSYLDGKIGEILATKPRRAGGGGGPIYSAALALHFYVHLHEKGKDPAAEKMARSLVAYLSDCIGEEVGTSVWKKGRDGGTVWFISGVTALLNNIILALGRAKAAGFQVPASVLRVAEDYYAKYFEKNGSVKYDQHNMFPNEPRQGRTITAILALKVLGVNVDRKYKSSLKYARENIEKTMTHHVPSLHMTLCAYTFRALGGKDWKKYVDTYFRKLIARQQEDGSVLKMWDHDGKLMMTPNDTLWGATYATTHFALILQIPLGHVELYRSK